MGEFRFTTSFTGPDGRGGDIALVVRRDVAACDGVVGAFDDHVLGVHLGAPARVRQRREDHVHEGVFAHGDLTMIPARWQSTCWTKDRSGFLHVHVPDVLLGRVAEGIAPSGGREAACLFRFDDAVCRELALSMLHEAETGGDAAAGYIEASAVVLAARMLRAAGLAVRPAARSGLSLPVLRRAKELLYEGMDRNVGVVELADAAGMNVHHFSRMFKRSTGLSPHRYLGQIRVEHAKTLLADARRRIVDVAAAVGFANASHFAAFFRKATGMTPGAYRRAVGCAGADERDVTNASAAPRTR
ncbi:helix-turn-helix domain-containing protein [Sorangium sp. So ce131]|uniref:helix-turn-helix domain-containing protein n=1 Tax=Sorangium sp. So ce131 TaxID=3133282 RepID=UPI003F62536B